MAGILMMCFGIALGVSGVSMIRQDGPGIVSVLACYGALVLILKGLTWVLRSPGQHR